MKNNTDAAHSPTSGKVAFWYDPRKRSILYQLGVLAMVGLLGYYLISNTHANLEKTIHCHGIRFSSKGSCF